MWVHKTLMSCRPSTTSGPRLLNLSSWRSWRTPPRAVRWFEISRCRATGAILNLKTLRTFLAAKLRTKPRLKCSKPTYPRRSKSTRRSCINSRCWLIWSNSALKNSKSSNGWLKKSALPNKKWRKKLPPRGRSSLRTTTKRTQLIQTDNLCRVTSSQARRVISALKPSLPPWRKRSTWYNALNPQGLRRPLSFTKKMAWTSTKANKSIQCKSWEDRVLIKTSETIQDGWT